MERKKLKVSAKAPAFTLVNQDGEEVALKQLAGKWTVLYFYPRDNTPGCTIEAEEFTAALKKFHKINAEVIGVSPDSPESHQKFIDKKSLKIQLLSDPEHKVLEKYGAWGDKVLYGKKSEGVIRSTVIIDPQGKIAYYWARVQTKGHAEAVLDKLRELQKQTPDSD